MNVYETITARIIAQLEDGIIPWRKEWKGTGEGRIPYNFTTGKPYRGINTLVLLCADYASQAWMTYKQAQELGANVRKGEKGTPIVFWSFPTKKGKGDAEPAITADSKSSEYAFARYYTVFNVEQVEGLQPALPFDVPPFDCIGAADAVVDGYMGSASHPTLAHGGGRAFFSPSRDHVQMPTRESFTSPAAYYATLFHEFAHSTGTAGRLARKMSTANAPFGSEEYSDEELCAEFSSAFLSAESGIANDALLTNSAAYIQAWLRKLKNDPKMAVYAAQRAQKAADYILQRTAVTSSEVAA
jgi:antirestriction protein ArdC